MKDRLKEVTEAAILDAAEAVLAKDGLHGAKMEAIAAAAGVAVGTLYNYFGDRQALLEALLEARRAELVRRLDELPQRGLRFRERLETFVGATLAHVLEHAAFFRIAMQAEHAPVPWTKGAMRELHVRCQQLIELGLRERVLQPAPVRLYASLLLGMLRGAVMSSLYYDEPSDPAESAAVLARVFVDGAARR